MGGSIIESRGTRSTSAENHLLEIPPFAMAVQSPDIFPGRDFILFQMSADMRLLLPGDVKAAACAVPNIGLHCGLDRTDPGVGQSGTSGEDALGSWPDWNTTAGDVGTGARS